MRVHVLPGDAVAAEFKKSGIDGDVIVCRECLVVGPIGADTPFEFWDERARFILAEYGEDEIEFHERVADELEKLRDIEPGTEVILWFEYELFCSVNLWFCISMLRGTGADIFRVEPIVRSIEDRWKGFGGLDPAELARCLEKLKLLSADDISLGSDLWDAYRKDDRERLLSLADPASDSFPYVKEVCEAASVIDNKPAEILAAIRAEGKTEFADIFAEFSKRAGVYGFGDLQVERVLDNIS
jgi:hypothetical protein